MTSRRGHGEGSIYQRESDGKWVASITLERVAGKRVRKTFYADTRRDVKDKLTRALHDQQRGLPISTDRQTVAQFLARWLTETAKPSVRPKTYTSYEQIVRLHLTPELGAIRLEKLTPQDVQRFMNRKLAANLSPRTVDICRCVLRQALNHALRWGIVSRNVAALVNPPKQKREIHRFLTPDEARGFLDVVRGERLEALFTVAVAVGLRQGEALGLRWRDVDLDSGTLTVRHGLQRIDGTLQIVEPKTALSRRTIALPAIALRALKDHRRRQLEERLLAGPLWVDGDFVFASHTGTPLDARNVVRHFHTLRERAGLKWLRFHDLRHAFGSLLAAQGVHPRVAMELMGHSQLSVTMQIYTHVAPELAREAALSIDAALGN